MVIILGCVTIRNNSIFTHQIIILVYILFYFFVIIELYTLTLLIIKFGNTDWLTALHMIGQRLSAK